MSKNNDDDQVFGAIHFANTPNITIVFVCVFIFMAILDRIFDVLGKVSNEFDVYDIYEQFQYKLLVLGLISLSVFFIQACIGFQALQSFNIVLLVILFMAFCFIVETIALVSLCKSVGQKYVEALQTPETELLEEYQQSFMPILERTYKYERAQHLVAFLDLADTKKSLKASQFWNRIEIKIIEELFVDLHNLPKEFEYGHYMSHLFIKYITNVGNVTSISWFVLAVLVFVNYLKTLVDNSAEVKECIAVNDDFTNKSDSDLHCYVFLFNYFFALGVVLNLAILIVYLFSVKYTRDIIRKGMSDIFDIDAEGTHDTDVVLASAETARPCCNIFGKPYRDQFYTPEWSAKYDKGIQMNFFQLSYERLGWGVSSFTQQQYIWCLHRLYTWRIEEEKYNNSNQNPNRISHSNNHIAAGTSSSARLSKTQNIRMSMYKNTLAKRKSALEKLLVRLNEEKGESFHKKEVNKHHQQQQHKYELFEHQSEENRTNVIWGRIYYFLCCRWMCFCCDSKNKDTDKDNNKDTSAAGRNGLHSSTNNDTDNEEYNKSNSKNTVHKNDEDGSDDIGTMNMNSIFYFNRPKIFFMFVDIVFLLNTFYSAVYFTQILPICVHTESVWWGVMQFLPMFFGFSMLRFILLRSVLLQTITTLDADMAGRIIEDSIDALTIADSVRYRIIEKFYYVNEKMNGRVKMKVIKLCFQEIDTNNNGTLDKYEFRVFLGNLEVFLTKDKFNLLWKYIDTDNNGRLSRDEIMVFLFPELKSVLKEELKVIKKIRKRVRDKQWNEKDLKEIFRIYDRDNSNTIEKEELKEMLMGPKFGIKDMTESSFKVLFAAMDADKEGNLSWEEFYAVIWPVRSESSLLSSRSAMNNNNNNRFNHSYDYNNNGDEEDGKSEMSRSVPGNNIFAERNFQKSVNIDGDVETVDTNDEKEKRDTVGPTITYQPHMIHNSSQFKYRPTPTSFPSPPPPSVNAIEEGAAAEEERLSVALGRSVALGLLTKQANTPGPKPVAVTAALAKEDEVSMVSDNSGILSSVAPSKSQPPPPLFIRRPPPPNNAPGVPTPLSSARSPPPATATSPVITPRVSTSNSIRRLSNENNLNTNSGSSKFVSNTITNSNLRSSSGGNNNNNPPRSSSTGRSSYDNNGTASGNNMRSSSTSQRDSGTNGGSRSNSPRPSDREGSVSGSERGSGRGGEQRSSSPRPIEWLAHSSSSRRGSGTTGSARAGSTSRRGSATGAGSVSNSSSHRSQGNLPPPPAQRRDSSSRMSASASGTTRNSSSDNNKPMMSPSGKKSMTYTNYDDEPTALVSNLNSGKLY